LPDIASNSNNNHITEEGSEMDEDEFIEQIVMSSLDDVHNIAGVKGS